jgi:uncharacterized membrane protein YbhN (UPF0104 family)
MISNKTKQYITLFIKVCIVFLAFYFIYHKLQNDQNMTWKDFVKILQSKITWYWLIIMLFFSFLNRFLEILKWQNLANEIRPTTTKQASKEVLAALTPALFTPNGIGEYLGKAMFYPKNQTKNVVFLNLVCNGIQLIMSVIFGLIGLFYLKYKMFPNHTFISILFWGILGVLILFTLFILVTKSFEIKGYSMQILWKKIQVIPKKVHQKNSFLAVARYLTFSHQYYLLFIIFGINTNYFSLMATITCVYFIASSIPNFQFLDFMVKGSIAIFFFEKLGIDSRIVFFNSTFIWLVNVVLPVIIGSYFVLTFKNSSSKKI